jgi:hypothetical protein
MNQIQQLATDSSDSKVKEIYHTSLHGHPRRIHHATPGHQIWSEDESDAAENPHRFLHRLPTIHGFLG